MKVALVCIAKNEDKYIDEWVQYNLKLGFDDIFMCLNDWECDVEYEHLHKSTMNGLLKQNPFYNIWTKNNYNKYDWAAFFDLDEFLVLKKHNNIKEFIEDYKNYDSIGINWVLFGDNGIEKTEDGNFSVLERFTKRERCVSPTIKSIVKLKEDMLIGNHHPHGVSMVDPDFNEIRASIWNFKGTDNVAQLNHYFCKTKEEFKEKCERGRADGLPYQFRKMEEFEPKNKNEKEDLDALNFFKNKNI